MNRMITFSTLVLALGTLALPGCGDDEKTCEKFCNQIAACCADGSCTTEGCLDACENNGDIYNNAGMNPVKVYDCMRARLDCEMDADAINHLMRQCAAVVAGRDGACDGSGEQVCYSDVHVSCWGEEWLGYTCAEECAANASLDGEISAYTDYTGTCNRTCGEQSSETYGCWCKIPGTTTDCG